jgi:hypothetical protein
MRIEEIHEISATVDRKRVDENTERRTAKRLIFRKKLAAMGCDPIAGMVAIARWRQNVPL